MTSPWQIIDTLRAEGDDCTPRDVIAALEDGEALGNYNWHLKETDAARRALEGVRTWVEWEAKRPRDTASWHRSDANGND